VAGQNVVAGQKGTIMEKNALCYELVWHGRLHLGDEPGIYGDAVYTGLCTEWPMTFARFDPAELAPGRIVVRLSAEHVIVLDDHPGHKVTLARYEPGETPFRWKKVCLDGEIDYRLKSDAIELLFDVPGGPEVIYASVRIEVDATVQPGSYNDFLVTSLQIRSHTHYASLGFV
jgi:hypothetical protein